MDTAKPWAEKWTEVKSLGGGGQGDTWLVRSKADGARQAVLKLLKAYKVRDPKARRRMYQEVANLKILRSAGGKVPEVLDGDTEVFENVELPMFFVMEFVDGKMLSSLIEESHGLSVEPSLGITLDLCSTLRAASKEGIVHRDIKPENIIVRSIAPPDVVMVDFGLSFNEDTDPTNTSVDEGLDNKFVSLPERRGPGENKRDPRSDITDVCAILFYCLTGCSPRNLRDSQGRPPHRRPDYELSSRIQNPSQLALLNGLLDRGLNYELDSRFQKVEELIGRLNEVANPTAKRIVEDLDTVVAREAAALRKNDRKTQLSNYFTNLQPLAQSINQLVNDLQLRLSRHKAFSFGWLGGLTRATGKNERGDSIAVMSFMLSVDNHPLRYEFHYSVLAVGSECTLYREIQELIPGKATKIVEAPSAVFRYQGDNEIDRAAVIAEIRETVTRSIPLLSQRVQSGY
ncbi:MAG TPA: protein kinase [Verrucomicrobiae bacterium]|nr:protein kinase [Verrucomicrobiae bacterium]